MMHVLPLIGLILFAWIIQSTGLHNIQAAFADFDYRWILPVPLLIAVFITAKSYKWKWILRSYGIEYPLFSCAKAFLLGFFAGLVTPGKIGDGMRVAYLRRDTHTPIATGLSTLFIDRILDLLTLLVLVAVSMFILWRYYDFAALLPMVFVSGALIVVTSVVVTNERLIGMMLRPLFRWWVPERHKDRCRTMFRNFYGTMTEAKKHRGLIAKAFAINIVAWCVTVTDFYILARALNIPMRALQLFAIVPVTMFVEILPLSISGVGTRDATLIFLFRHLGLPVSKAVAFSLTYLVFAAWSYGILGLLVWFRHPIAFSRARKQSDDAAEKHT